jgi:ArsR family transcriptional regulator
MAIDLHQQPGSPTTNDPSDSKDAPDRDIEDTLDQAAETLRFLSDRNRLRILARLTRAESCVCDLIDDLGLAQPLVSYHLGKLRRAGLVRARRDAQWMYYSLEPEAWRALLDPVRDLLQAGPLPPEAAWGAGRACDPTEPGGEPLPQAD